MNNMNLWILFGFLVYLVPLCVYLHQTRWLPRLVSPVLDRLGTCPRWMMLLVAVFVAQMVVIGGWKEMPDPDPEALAAINYPVAHPTNTWYVTPLGSDANAGTNWTCALATIQAAIDRASSNAVVNVSACEGSDICVYTPIKTDNKSLLIQSVDRYGEHRKPVIIGDGTDSCADLCGPAGLYWYGPRESILKGFTLSKGSIGVYGGIAVDCVITDNANLWGWAAGAQAAKLVNCLVYGNMGPGTIDSVLVNCTIAQNCSAENAAISPVCSAYNCIIWNNTNAFGQVSDITEYNPPTPSPEGWIPLAPVYWMKLWGCYSDMDPGLSTDTTYCADPMFVDPDNGDYHLVAGSPCIDAGFQEYAVSGETTDLDGMLRVRDRAIDLGCYEYVDSPATPSDESIQVPYWWMWQHGLFAFDATPAAILAAAYSDSQNKKGAGSHYKVWESYIADLDPANSNQTFSVSISMTNGIPEISFSPSSPRRRYELMGAQTPSGPWAVTNDFSVIDFRATNRFFKVGVELR